MHERIVESLTSFFDGHTSVFSREHKWILLEAFTASTQMRTAKMLLEDMEAGKPVILNAGWFRHAINIVIVDSYLFICNGGEGIPSKENTIAAFKIDRKMINSRKLNKILWFIKERHSKDEGTPFFYEEVPKMFSPGGRVVKDDLCRIVEGISPSKIRVGICSLACGKIALRVIGTMLKVRRVDPRNYKGMARMVAREAKQWSLYSRMYYLDQYMEKHKMATLSSVTSSKEGNSELVLESWKKIRAYFLKNFRIFAYRHLALERKLKKILG